MITRSNASSPSAKRIARGPAARFTGSRSLIGLALVALVAVALLAACESCRRNGADNDATTQAGEAPTFRLYLASDLAGALEPCGCVEGQPGGVNHAVAWMRGEKLGDRAALLVAGPTFFLDPELAPDKRAQELEKAKTIADSLKMARLLAWAPGRNDFAGGAEFAEALAGRAGAPLLMANAERGGKAAEAFVVRELGGVKVGIVGASDLGHADLGPPEGYTFESVGERVASASKAARAKGANIIVVLAATGRGEAKRLADRIPDLDVVVVGSTGGRGEANTNTPPAELIGKTLIVETGNHLTAVATLDFFSRGGDFNFQDDGSLAFEAKRRELESRVAELEAKVRDWEKTPGIAKSDLDARKADLEKRRAELSTMKPPARDASKSTFRLRFQTIDGTLGSDEATEKRMLAYYKLINDANKKAFKDKLPPPAPDGEAHYVGIAVCSTCHTSARAVWDKTSHAHAYSTLEKQHKEFNLDCVSCHVTGYDKPGGSTVVHVERLKNVQCEVCHGPGSQHVSNPTAHAIPLKKPGSDVCTGCHHPPHVASFDPKQKRRLILGPGHGQPE